MVVVYNVVFDYGFLNVVIECCKIKCILFYLFVSFDIILFVGFVLG